MHGRPLADRIDESPPDTPPLSNDTDVQGYADIFANTWANIVGSTYWAGHQTVPGRHSAMFSAVLSRLRLKIYRHCHRHLARREHDVMKAVLQNTDTLVFVLLGIATGPGRLRAVDYQQGWSRAGLAQHRDPQPIPTAYRQGYYRPNVLPRSVQSRKQCRSIRTSAADH